MTAPFSGILRAMKTPTSVLVAALALLAIPALAAETPEDRWNLADVYATPLAWQQDAGKLESQLKEFAACRGRLGDSAKRFKSCLDLQPTSASA